MCTLKRNTLIIILSAFVFLNLTSPGFCNESESPKDTKLNVYKVDLNSIDDFHIIKKGTKVSFNILEDINTKKNKLCDLVAFEMQLDNTKIKATGNITKLLTPKRISKSGLIQFSTNKLILEDGQEINFNATSSLAQAIHPLHTNSDSLKLASRITALSIGTSPITFGSSLILSFLVNGIQSAHQNGIGDFFWGGLEGSGLSFIERIFRKQPDVFLPSSTEIPFTLTEDLKIPKGIIKEDFDYIPTKQEDPLSKIQKLLQWGDLSGALEYSSKTGQVEIYNEILEKIL